MSTNGKRFQIFVSSTFRDLVDERQAVLNTILQMNHMPAGMEFFPGTHAPPWDLIKRVIDASDYYVLVVGGKYGSLHPIGISYTENEYDYAYEKGKPVLALMHADPDSLPHKKCESDPDIVAKLEAFRKKVMNRHHIKRWSTAADLIGVVAIGLHEQFNNHPAVGWVRGDAVASLDTMTRLADVQQRLDEQQQRNAELEQEILAIRLPPQQSPEEVADGLASWEAFWVLMWTLKRNVGYLSLERLNEDEPSQRNARVADLAARLLNRGIFRHAPSRIVHDAIQPTVFGWEVVRELRRRQALRILAEHAWRPMSEPEFSRCIDADPTPELLSVLKDLVADDYIEYQIIDHMNRICPKTKAKEEGEKHLREWRSFQQTDDYRAWIESHGEPSVPQVIT
jgi:hypothetical protein